MNNKMQNENMAFPKARYSEGGITKREYFAAMALQGLLSRNDPAPPDNLAMEAFRFADAMLLETEKKRPE